jgi:hypothetical protein
MLFNSFLSLLFLGRLGTSTSCSSTAQTILESLRMCTQDQEGRVHHHHQSSDIKPEGSRRGNDGQYRPRCLTARTTGQQYCVFTNHTFSDGRGISIFTTSGQARAIFKLSAAHADSNHNHAISTPPYAIQHVLGHGTGVVANSSIARGDEIMSNTPMLVLHDDIFTHFSEKQRRRIQRLAVEQLPQASRESFMNLAGQFGGDAVTDILDTNSFEVTMFQAHGVGTPYIILVPEIAVCPWA